MLFDFPTLISEKKTINFLDKIEAEILTHSFEN